MRPKRPAPHAGSAAHRTPPRPRGMARNVLLRALRRRQTPRAFSDRKLPAEALPKLLWAAFGVNRTRGALGGVGRTAASASNSREIDVYVALPDGACRDDAPRHRLELVVPEDLRAFAISRGQAPVDPGAIAPVRPIDVADVDRLVHTHDFPEPGLRDPQVQRAYYYVEAARIDANVYRFAAATGPAASLHNCDRARRTDETRR